MESETPDTTGGTGTTGGRHPVLERLEALVGAWETCTGYFGHPCGLRRSRVVRGG